MCVQTTRGPRAVTTSGTRLMEKGGGGGVDSLQVAEQTIHHVGHVSLKIHHLSEEHF